MRFGVLITVKKNIVGQSDWQYKNKAARRDLKQVRIPTSTVQCPPSLCGRIARIASSNAGRPENTDRFDSIFYTLPFLHPINAYCYQFDASTTSTVGKKGFSLCAVFTQIVLQS